jgi:hypothetical protein
VDDPEINGKTKLEEPQRKKKKKSNLGLVIGTRSSLKICVNHEFNKYPEFMVWKGPLSC